MTAYSMRIGEYLQRITNGSAQTAWAAATSQTGQLAELSALWSGDVEIRGYSLVGTLLTTLTYSGWNTDTSEATYFLQLDTLTDESLAAEDVVRYCKAFIPGGAEVVAWDISPVVSSDLSKIAVNGLRINATASLPASPLPTWLASSAVNEWIEISGTTWDGCEADIYNDSNSQNSAHFCNIAVVGTKIVLAAGGGHSDSSDNSVKSIDLNANAPAWLLNIARSSSAQADVAYYADGKPSSRHLYWSAHYSTTLGRLMLHRTRFTWPNAVSFDDTNGVNLASNTWDADGTYANGYSAQCVDANDAVWYFDTDTCRKWVPAIDTWTTKGTFGSGQSNGPYAADTTRGTLFGLSVGNGWGSGAGFITANRYSSDGTVRDTITISASSAYTDWLTDDLGYASMVYDSTGDRFLFYTGSEDRSIYVVTPDGTTTWPMSKLTTTGTPPPLAYTEATVSVARKGGFGRMALIDSLGVLVFLPSLSDNVYAMRIR